MAVANEEALRKLVEERGRVKAALTRLKNFCDSQGTTATRHILGARLEKGVPLISKFEAIQDQIDSLVAGTPEEQIHEQFREGFETQYFELIGALREFIERLQAPVSSSLGAQHALRVANASPASVNSSNPVRLPSIPLPQFHGSLGEWVFFRDSFEALINRNDSLGNIERFHYLKSALKGEAACILDALAMSEDNYEVAWSLLRERYEDTNELIDHHVGALFNLPIIPWNSPKGLRQLIDGFKNNVRSLKSLKEPVEQWDTLLTHLLATKLDGRTREEWERRVSSLNRRKTLADIQTFLEQHHKFIAKCAEDNKAAGNSHGKSGVQAQPRFHPRSRPVTLVAADKDPNCPLCGSNHRLFQCNGFKALALTERKTKAKELRVCFNCLRSGHGAKGCTQGRCHECHAKHHTLLHFGSESKPLATPVVEEMAARETTTSQDVSCMAHVADEPEHVMLSTAIIYIIDNCGKRHECRALLDQGSQVNILKESFARRLGLTWQPTSSTISGIGATDTSNQVTGKTRVRIASRYNSYRANLPCVVMTQVTAEIPNFRITRASFKIPSHIQLADPNFDVPRDIDLIIGNGFLWDIMSVGQHRLGKGLPLLIKSQLGWVFGGRIREASQGQSPLCNVVTNQQLSDELTRFWEIEQMSVANTHINHPCEEHFTRTVRRNSEGRYEVTIPFIDEKLVQTLGNSRNMAENRFLGVEKKFTKSPELQQAYVAFMQEYINLGHMSKLSPDSLISTHPVYYLPHHAVVKAASTTTKVRVVFDGSAKTSTGISLNDIQQVGPIVQDDLFSILIRFRQHRVVLSADIVKMYRQILVTAEQRPLQRIVWREKPTRPIDTYELNTVTYGTASAPFLATRVLRQVGLENREQHSTACRIITDDFYVDDLLTGADSSEQVIIIKQEVERLLHAAGFELSKWASNDSSVIRRNGETSKTIVKQSEKDPRTLGLLWEPSLDNLKIATNIQISKRITKRTILSQLARIFDPLGLVGPVVICAKLLMQTLWKLGLTWDESVPQNIHSEFVEFQTELESLTRLSIPRYTMGSTPAQVEMHGFCDASEKAYGACIYLRTTDNIGRITAQLLCAKSRVAPLKTLSVPRLELCGAVLLAQLMERVRSATRCQIVRETCWTDSMITLAWINGSPSRWKTFVANRVTEVQNLSQGTWHHVASEDNPADLLSRGVRPSTLDNLSLWWNGPSWLLQNSSHWPTTGPLPLSVPEEKLVVCTATKVGKIRDLTMLEKFSGYTRLLRVIGWCLKFYGAVRTRQGERDNGTGSKRVRQPNKPRCHLTVVDLELAETTVLKLIQEHAFSEEISHLQSGQVIPTTSRLLCLSPFLDDKGLLRVGGRLGHARVRYEQQHPTILPRDHFITKLIIRREHERMLHAGCETVLSAIRLKYWPIAGRTLVKGVIRKCMRCNRTSPRGISYIMGQLPAARVRARAPFFSTGVDYAGPLYVKDRTRSKTSSKVYLCLFVCLATKAVHLELTTNLTTESFLNCLNRFIARRGHCREIYSDNGTNFVGARNELQRMREFLQNESNQRHIYNYAVTEGLDWNFIPPHAPHFGGLWESSVKAAKRHLLRVIGETRLTFEELYTVLTRVEACLNSRPLHPVSSDPNDFTPLTPGHFLTGGPLTEIHYPDVTDVKVNRLSRFQLLQAMYQHFWKRWQRDYLHQLQQRNKWKQHDHGQLAVGTMVVIKEDNLPPLQWRLGRVAALHPGKDNVTRVVSIRTADGIIKRPVVKICLLPMDDETSNTKDQPEGPSSTDRRPDKDQDMDGE